MCKLCGDKGYVEKTGNVICKICNETGIYERDCPACNGTGLFTTKNDKEVFCRKCNGTGIFAVKCNRCNGKGYKEYNELIICPRCKNNNSKLFNPIKIKK